MNDNSSIYGDLIREARATEKKDGSSPVSPQENALINSNTVKDQEPQHVQLVDIASIYRPKQQRLHFDQREIDKLARSMKDNGFRGSILVSVLPSNSTQRSDGFKYELVYGESRIIAWKKLGNDNIPAEIQILEPKSIRRLRFDENMARKNLNPFEEIRGYLELMSDETSSSIEVVEQDLNALNNSGRGEVLSAEILDRVHIYQEILDRYGGGKILTFRTKLIKFRNLPEDVCNALEAGNISASQALELGSIKTQADRANLLSWITEKQPSVAELRKQKKQLQEQTQEKNYKVTELNNRVSNISKRFRKITKREISPSKTKILSKIEELLDELEN